MVGSAGLRITRFRALGIAGVLVVTATAGCGGGRSAASSSSTTSPRSTTTTSSSGPSTTTSVPSTPGGSPGSYVRLYPFASEADAAQWQASYRSGGHEPWHVDARQTSLAFVRYLGLSGVDQTFSDTENTSGAHVAVGFLNPNGGPVTSAVVHLVRLGAGTDVPWEVVGTDDGPDFTITQPAYGSHATSPLVTAGTITGVDESIRVAVWPVQASSPAGTACCRAAGGQRSPWSVSVTFSAAPGSALTVVASTGGHLQAVERFVVTGIRA